MEKKRFIIYLLDGRFLEVVGDEVVLEDQGTVLTVFRDGREVAHFVSGAWGGWSESIYQ